MLRNMWDSPFVRVVTGRREQNAWERLSPDMKWAIAGSVAVGVGGAGLVTSMTRKLSRDMEEVTENSWREQGTKQGFKQGLQEREDKRKWNYMLDSNSQPMIYDEDTNEEPLKQDTIKQQHSHSDELSMFMMRDPLISIHSAKERRSEKQEPKEPLKDHSDLTHRVILGFLEKKHIDAAKEIAREEVERLKQQISIIESKYGEKNYIESKISEFLEKIDNPDLTESMDAKEKVILWVYQQKKLEQLQAQLLRFHQLIENKLGESLYKDYKGLPRIEERLPPAPPPHEDLPSVLSLKNDQLPHRHLPFDLW